MGLFAHAKRTDGPGVNLAFSVCGLLLLFVSLAIGTSAAPLDTYHARLKQATTALDTLLQKDEDETEFDYEIRTARTCEEIRRMLPTSEEVTWKDARISVDNSWIHDHLKHLERASSPDRQSFSGSLSARLHAVEQQIAQMATPESVGDKGAARQKLDEILTRPEFAKNSQEESALWKLLNRFLDRLRDLLPKPKPLSASRAEIFRKIAQYFVVVLAVLVIGYALKLLGQRLLHGRSKKTRTKLAPRVVLGETLDDEQSAQSLLADAEALALKGELRGAIRKAYIALLLELANRKLIGLAQHKTNRDYLEALRNVEPLYGKVRFLTDRFEKHWYGLAGATETDWLAFRDGYNQALS